MVAHILRPEEIARRALAVFFDQIGQRLNVHTDMWFAEQECGNTVFIAGIADDAAAIPVVLDHQPEVSFEITSHELTLPIHEFGARFIEPAMPKLTREFDQAVIAAGTLTARVVSAALPVPPGAIAASVETYQGISLRVCYSFDFPTRTLVVSLDTLFGVVTPEQLAAPKRVIRVWDLDWNLVGHIQKADLKVVRELTDGEFEFSLAADHPIAKWIGELDDPCAAHITVDRSSGDRWCGDLYQWWYTGRLTLRWNDTLTQLRRLQDFRNPLPDDGCAA